MTTLLNDPYGPFANKKVAVVGSGDSGKTIMEFLTRVGVGAAGFGGGNIVDMAQLFQYGLDKKIAHKRNMKLHPVHAIVH